MIKKSKTGVVKEDVYYINDEVKYEVGTYVGKAKMEELIGLAHSKGDKVTYDEDMEMWYNDDNEMDVPEEFVKKDKK